MLRSSVLLAAAALAALVVAVAGASGAGSSPSAFPVTVIASNGKVTVKARPSRIVSLSPTATETLFAIGAGPQVVAVDNQSDYPKAAPQTSLSGFTPNVEAIESSMRTIEPVRTALIRSQPGRAATVEAF